MKTSSDRRARTLAAAISFEGLEDRRLMSVGTVVNSGAVRLETNLGRITLLLTPDVTPQTVNNFLSNYVGKKLYDNTIVHRSVPGFIVQFGGYKVASGYPHIAQAAPVNNEFDLVKAALPAGQTEVNTRGTVAMAKLGTDPNSATSEFFINLADNSSNLDAQNGGFTTFATVLGGGMHVADAIANLQVIDGSGLNSAFTDLPVVQTASGPNPVVVSSAVAQRVLPVKLDATTKMVTWVDEKGSITSITLSKGTADLTFIGGNDMDFREQGNKVIITGKGVDLQEITARHTDKSSVLAIQSEGGSGPAHVGNITVVGGSIGQINASSVQVQGDITAADGSIGKVDVQGTFRTTISAKDGHMNVRIASAFDTSIVTGGTIDSLVVQRWADDGEMKMKLNAAAIKSMVINGNFSSNMAVTGNVGTLNINGNVGTLGENTWTIGGNANKIVAGKLIGLTLKGVKDLGSFTAREVVAAASGTATTITARSIGTVSLATLQNQAVISGIKGIKSVAIKGLMDSSTIRSEGPIGSVSAKTITGNTPGATAGVLVPSNIYAGVVSTFSASPVTQPGSFIKGSGSGISQLTVKDTFSNTNVAAPKLGTLKLGKVQAASSTHFGVTANTRIASLDAIVKSKLVQIRNATTQDQIDAVFSKLKIANDNQSNGNRFTVSIV